MIISAVLSHPQHTTPPSRPRPSSPVTSCTINCSSFRACPVQTRRPGWLADWVQKNRRTWRFNRRPGHFSQKPIQWPPGGGFSGGVGWRKSVSHVKSLFADQHPLHCWMESIQGVLLKVQWNSSHCLSPAFIGRFPGDHQSIVMDKRWTPAVLLLYWFFSFPPGTNTIRFRVSGCIKLATGDEF